MANKPHLIFWSSIPIVLLIGILNRNEMLDVNVLDTYFVFSKTDLAIVISILFAMMGSGYWIMQKADRRLSKWLNLIHIALTFGGTLVVWILTKLYRTEIMEYEFNNNLTLITTLIVLLLVIGQLIFPINIIYGLSRRKN